MKITWTFEFLYNGKRVTRVLTYEGKTVSQVIDSVKEWLLSMAEIGYEFVSQEVKYEEASPSPK